MQLLDGGLVGGGRNNSRGRTSVGVSAVEQGGKERTGEFLCYLWGHGGKLQCCGRGGQAGALWPETVDRGGRGGLGWGGL